MVMAQTVQDLYSAYDFKNAYDAVTAFGDICEMYVGNTPRAILDRFERGEIRTLVIVGKLLEGYDNKRVSVVGIVRNVAKQSKVLFTQFVGRAVRKCRSDDPVTAMIISHQMFNQRVNFDQFDTVTDEENSDHE
jgi:superfamily II DNA or RNA helicase